MWEGGGLQFRMGALLVQHVPFGYRAAITSTRIRKLCRNSGHLLIAGAGFYLNATADKYSKNYNMYDLVVKEIPKVLKEANLGLVSGVLDAHLVPSPPASMNLPSPLEPG